VGAVSGTAPTPSGISSGAAAALPLLFFSAGVALVPSSAGAADSGEAAFLGLARFFGVFFGAAATGVSSEGAAVAAGALPLAATGSTAPGCCFGVAFFFGAFLFFAAA